MTGAPDILWHGAAPADAGVAAVVLHGRGQTPQDMLPMLADLQGVTAALPMAVGKSWYKARAVDPLSDATRGDLAASLAALEATIALVRKAVPGRPLLLAGFSQGACLAIEYALSRGGWDGALVALTGARVGAATDARPRAGLNAMPVYLSGGDADPWIPVAAWAAAAGELAQAGARLTAEVFPGRAHEVSAAEQAVLANTCAALMKGEVRA
jgi:predicted esterase